MTEEEPRPEPKKKKPTTHSDKHSPVKVIREGGIAASIWEKTTAHGMTYLEFTLSRSWQSKSGSTGYSQAFFPRSHDALVSVIAQATKWIADAEAKQAAAHSGNLAV